MPEKVEVEDLKSEQIEKAKQGQCPFCNSAMQDLNPPSNPKAREYYCAPCHWSYPIGRK